MRIDYTSGASAETPRTLPVDRVRFERQFGHVIGGGGGGVSEEQILWMAWTQLHRVGQADDDFDTWVATVQDWVPDPGDGEDDDVDPTDAPQEPPTG